MNSSQNKNKTMTETTTTTILLLVAVAASAMMMMSVTQEAYAHHTTDPNASITGERHGGESTGQGLTDHGCGQEFNSLPHQQGDRNSGSQCSHQSLVE